MPTADPDRFAIVPIHTDASGTEVKFPNAIMTGSMSAVMARVKDSKQMRADLRISNEAGKVRKAIADLTQREHTIAQREQAIAEREEDIAALISKMDTLAARVDLFEEQKRADAEEQQRAAISAAEYSLPPGSPVDPAVIEDEDEPEPTHHPSGELHSVAPSAPAPKTGSSLLRRRLRLPPLRTMRIPVPVPCL